MAPVSWPQMVQDSKVYPGRGVDWYSLSSMQQGMLFHSMESGAKGVDVEQVVCELTENLDAGCFERAWREVVARHAILRTSFHWVNGEEPRQIVHAPADARLAFRSEEFGSEMEAWRGLQDYLAHDRNVGFEPDIA